MERFAKLTDAANTVELLHDARVSPGRAPGEISQAQRIAYTHTRTVAVSPEVLRTHRILTGDAAEPARAAFNVLRTQVLRRMRAAGWNTLAITSAGIGEGKTLTAVNLAISIAREANHTVMLVDADLRRPAVARCFGLAPEHGLRDVLLDDVPPADVLFHPAIDRLVVLPGGKPVEHSSELLCSPKMSRLVAEAKARYPARVVLFDLPPLLAGDDVLAFAPGVDAVLLVIEEGKTRRDDLAHAIALLRDVPLLGTVLNKSEIQHSSGAYY